MPALITTNNLAALMREPEQPLIFDASWHLHNANRNALNEFAEKHIVKARFLDLNAFCDRNHPLPNMLSSDPAFLAKQLGMNGIHMRHKIVLYDNSIFHTSCRAYWILRLSGHPHENIFILNGGLHAWEKYSGPMATGNTPMTPSTNYAIQYQSHLLCHLDDVKTALRTQSAQIIDVRHPVRFAGGPEPRPGLRSGHIPGSFSFPYLSFTDRSGYFWPLEKIRKNLFDIGVNLNAPIISTCGSGMSAPILNFFLSLMKHPDHKLYDGSWCEWGSDQCYPNEKDLSERPVETCLE